MTVAMPPTSNTRRLLYVGAAAVALVASGAVGVVGYLAAFVLSLLFDQPFAPVQVAVLLVMALVLRGTHAVLNR